MKPDTTHQESVAEWWSSFKA